MQLVFTIAEASTITFPFGIKRFKCRATSGGSNVYIGASSVSINYTTSGSNILTPIVVASDFGYPNSLQFTGATSLWIEDYDMVNINPNWGAAASTASVVSEEVADDGDDTD